MHGTIDSALRVEWRPLTELASIASSWRRLAERALEPNVFYEPAFALAAAPALGCGVSAALVWTRSDELVGLFPGRIEPRRYGMRLPVLVGWAHPFAPLGAPLVDRSLAEPVITAWLEHVAAHAELPKLILLPLLPEGALARTLETLTRARGQVRVVAEVSRALLAPQERGGYLAAALGSKRRKELNRLRKRLAERGPVTSVSAHNAAEVALGLDDFLHLEAGGWKGRAGTAACQDPAIAAFIKAAVLELAGQGKAEITRLCVDNEPIAAGIILRSGAYAWAWKIAYDERYAHFSPGVQLICDVTQGLVAEPEVGRADSCATANHPMIDHIWRERLTLADVLLCVGAKDSSMHSLSFEVAWRMEAWRRTATHLAKRVVQRARAFARGSASRSSTGHSPP
ncbi:MAG: GNAT family N-acetyltransferase [Xanthobacteraceae bacterium]